MAAISRVEKEAELQVWTVTTLQDYLMKLFDVFEKLQDGKFQTQTIARTEADARYTQRFMDSEKAVSAALAAAKEAVNAALIAADRAVSKAEDAANKRFESVNEFRGTLSDQAATMLTRLEAEQRFQQIETRLSKIEKVQSEANGAATRGEKGNSQLMWGVGVLVAVGVSLISMAVAVFTKFVHAP